MPLIAYVQATLLTRLAELRRDGERGDSPVPTAVIIMVLVVVAMAVTAAALVAADNWMNAVPDPAAPTLP
jgi:multisubunit Na+/H+ antiporter MnhC subunit